MKAEATIDALKTDVFRIPTAGRESDGTLDWDATTVVAVHADAGDASGLGWTYASRATAVIIEDVLKSVVVGADAFDIEKTRGAMARALRNVGRRGAGAMALSAVDVALWDVKAQLLQKPLVELFGRVRDSVQLYGSGGFTNLEGPALADQLGGWIARGFRRVKMKIGRDAVKDHARVATARAVAPSDVELFVDANGAYNAKQAIRTARWLTDEAGVMWFEEPCSSDDVDGLRLVRDNVMMDVAAGEYAETLDDFRALMPVVDCIQADATRCGGFSGFLDAAALCDEMHLPLSAHCAPQLHAHVGCAARQLRHVEHFFDHARVDELLFDGCLAPIAGTLTPDRSRPGHGITLKRADAGRFRVR